MAKHIKLHNNTYEELSDLKRDGETFDEFIARLIQLFRLLQKVQAEKLGGF